MSQVEFDTDQQLQQGSAGRPAAFASARASSPDEKRRRAIQLAIAAVAGAVAIIAWIYGAFFQGPPQPSRQTYEYQQPQKPLGI